MDLQTRYANEQSSTRISSIPTESRFWKHNGSGRHIQQHPVPSSVDSAYSDIDRRIEQREWVSKHPQTDLTQSHSSIESFDPNILDSEGVITSCRRIQNPPLNEERLHWGGMQVERQPTPGVTGVNSPNRPHLPEGGWSSSILNNGLDWVKQKVNWGASRDRDRPPTSSARPPYTDLFSSQKANGQFDAAERSTVSMPKISLGPKPMNRLGKHENTPDTYPPLKRAKVFDLSSPAQHDRTSYSWEESSTPGKGQRTSPNKIPTRAPSRDVQELLGPQSSGRGSSKVPGDYVSVPKSSWPEQIVVGGGSEYQNVEKTVGFYNKRSTRQPPQSRNGSFHSSDTKSRLPSIDLEEVTEGSKVLDSGYQGTANLRPHRVTARLNPARYRSPSIVIDGSRNKSRSVSVSDAYGAVAGAGNDLMVSSKATSEAVTNSQAKSKTKIPFQYVDERSESDDPITEVNGNRTSRRETGFERELSIGKRQIESHTLPTDGDIQSRLAKKNKRVGKITQSNSQPRQVHSLKGIITDGLGWFLNKNADIWDLRLDPNSQELRPFCNDKCRLDVPGRTLKPNKILSILWNHESPKVFIKRSAEHGVSSQIYLEINGPTSRHLIQEIQHINATVNVIDTTIEKLDKIARRTELQSTQEPNRFPVDLTKLELKGPSSGSNLQEIARISPAENSMSNPRQRDSRPRIRDSIKDSGETSPHFRPPKTNQKFDDISDDEIDRQHSSRIRGLSPRTRPETRSVNISQKSTSYREPSPLICWSHLHPDWKREYDWGTSLIYPPDAKKRAIVDQEDILRLDEGQFLNDNLLQFYLCHLEHQLAQDQPQRAKRIYFHNTYFYEALTKKVRSNNINYDAVKKWTSKIDLFQYDYIVVPINEKAHWYLAIICNAPKLLHTEDQDYPQSHDTSRENEQSQHERRDGSMVINSNLTKNDTGEDVEDQTHQLRQSSSSESVSQGVELLKLDGDLEFLHQPHLPHQESRRSELGKDITESSTIKITTTSPHSRLTSDPAKIASKGRKGKRKSHLVRKYDVDEPRVITFDSLGGPHSPACTNLAAYLICEAKEKHGKTINAMRLGLTAKNIPQQDNYCDCGLFVLGYTQEFLKDPDSFVHLIFRGELEKWDWKDLRASGLRDSMRTLIFDLQREQMVRQKETKAKDRAERKARREAKIPLLQNGVQPPQSSFSINDRSSPAKTSPTLSTTITVGSDSLEKLADCPESPDLKEQDDILIEKRFNKKTAVQGTYTAPETPSDNSSEDVTPSKSLELPTTKHLPIVVSESPLKPADLGHSDYLPSTSISPSQKRRQLPKRDNLFTRKSNKISKFEQTPVEEVKRTGASHAAPLEVDDSCEEDELSQPQKATPPQSPIQSRKKTRSSTSPKQIFKSPPAVIGSDKGIHAAKRHKE